MTTPADPVRARLAEIGQRVEAATEAPWNLYRYRHGGGRICIDDAEQPGRRRTLIADLEGEPDQIATAYNEGDREFLFAASSDVPALLAAVTAVLDRHTPVPLHEMCSHSDDERGAPASHAWETVGGEWVCGPEVATVCSTCHEDDGSEVDFPCDEYRAVSAALGVTE